MIVNIYEIGKINIKLKTNKLFILNYNRKYMYIYLLGSLLNIILSV